MTKNIIFITLITFIIFVPVPVAAVDSTPSAKAQDLLDRVATKVAQLSEKLQKSYHGRIKALGASSIVLVVGDSEKTVTTNDATSFFRIRAGNKTEVNFSALKIGDDVAAIGTIDPTTSDLTARQIIAKIKRTNLVGTITAVDKNLLTVDSIKIDLSDAATLKVIDVNGKTVNAKTSDFKVGSIIFAIIHSPDQNSGVFSVLKAMVLQK